jgi:class 3 adenylate cyclase/tetratricopeptide (TPR) repeat protein
VPQERKIVTVLFADIVNSSGTTRSYDPEVVREALAHTFSRTREILVAHGATVEKFIGDAVMAVFGAPIAHEDDAERAVRAAFGLRSEVSSVGGVGKPAITLRIGINTGEVVTGPVEGAENLVTGTPVIVAKRLEENAGHGEILVGPITRQITRGRIVYDAPRLVEGKGLGLIEAAAALDMMAAPSEDASQETLFVGRDAEMNLLAQIHTRVGKTGRPHLVTIYGEAGIGKSRIASAFLRTLDPNEPMARATCLPYGHAITYGPLQELIRGEAQIAATDGRDAARSKIETRVSRMAGLDEQEARAIARELTTLALADESSPAGELASDERRRELALGMTRYLEARLGGATGTIVLEDLHWAEEPFLALLDELLSHLRAPLLLLCLARPDLLERRPTWGSGHINAIAISLESLGSEDTKLLARSLLGEESGSRVDEIAERTEGNPLFVEEYARMLAEKGAHAVVPPTLQGVIAARLDGTSAPVKHLVQEASVIGRAFWLDALPTAPGTRDVDEAERRGLIARRARKGPTGSPTFIFRHGLIRDVAYASLSKAERVRVHDHYSRWLEAAAGERAQEYSEIVAYHAERAFDLAHEVEPASAASLGRRAFSELARTAGAASARGEFRAARELNDRALRVAGAAGVPQSEQSSVRSLAAILNLRLDSDSAAVNELEGAIAEARRLGPSTELVRLLVWRASSVTIYDDIEESERLFQEAVDIATRTGDREILAYAVWASAEPLGLTGRLEEQAHQLGAALEQIRASGSLYEVGCLAEICLNAIARGDRRRAREVADEAVAAARRSGRRMDRWRAASALATTLLADQDPEAPAAAEAALESAREVGGPGALAETAELASRARQQSGDLEAAQRVLDETFTQLDPAKMTVQREVITRLETRRSEVALARGNRSLARDSAATAIHLAPRRHVEARGAALLAMASVELADGRRDEAHRLIAEVRGLVAGSGFRDLQQRVERMGEDLTARSKAR